ncbi:MAG: phenylalanine--tRNA ligase subunit beta [bacterium]|nr:phenylalanine--tRNA ligase subunit beta [bacterium]
MKYSYKWLQEHLDRPLPEAEELARTITMKSFEVEGVEPHGDDTILDIKVLPDRAHDALSHRGMAREIVALFGLNTKEREAKAATPDPSVSAVRVSIEDPKRCPRYIGVRVDGVTVGTSPEWLQNKLASVGQRSINNIVDLTNFILFDLGQPMHAFDAAKVAGGITVRIAKSGEKMTTLDGKDLIFDGTELVIADDEGVLALAGVKGGKKAEVDPETTSIIFECANFDPTSTRKTSTKHNIKTDASKRYENGMTSELAGEATALALSELQKILPTAKVGAASDIYPNPEPKPVPVSVTLFELNGLLGSTMTEKDVEEVLKRLAHAGFTYELKNGAYAVIPPVSRLDIRIKEDLIEEVGRHYGYDKIVPTLPKLGRKGVPNKRLYYANKVRNFLVERGFSEVYTYSFAPKGEGNIEVVNPVGKDRPFMRESLVPGVERAIQSNLYNAPILEIEDIKIFEIGNVFSEHGEQAMFTMGAMGGTKKRWKTLSGEFYDTYDSLIVCLGEQKTIVPRADGIIEVPFDLLIARLPEPTGGEKLFRRQSDIAYQMLSTYPFIVRDVALWVPKETRAEDVGAIVRANAGELAQKIYLFDTFEKEDKKSFAFRMVLQSFERTLEDAEANAVCAKVVAALRATSPNWQVRT